MYAVREKHSKKLIHINPAPLSHELEGTDVYFQFDDKKMEIGKTEGALPEFFDITEEGEIIELDLEKKVAAGFVEIEPGQKIENDEIVEKTLSEKVVDGLIELASEQKVEGDQITLKTPAEMLEDGLISFDDIKQQKKSEFSDLALNMRNEILPDYKIQNALLGIYEDATVASYKKTIEEFRKEYHRLEGLVDKASSVDELEKIKVKFPK